QLAGGERRPLDARPHLRERRLARGRAVVGEGGKAAVVGGAELLDGNVPRREQDAVTHLVRRLDARVDRIRHPDEDPPARWDARGDRGEDVLRVFLPCELEVERTRLQLEERREQLL